MLGGEPARARELFEASLVANTNLLDQEGLSYCLDGLAAVAQMEGQSVAAARLYGTAERLRAVLGIDVWSSLQPFRDQRVADLRATLGETTFEQEREVGKAMRPADALGYIRETAGGTPPATA